MSVKKERIRRLQSEKDQLSNDNDVQQRKRCSGAGDGTDTAARRPAVTEPALLESADSELAYNGLAVPIELEPNEPGVTIVPAVIKVGDTMSSPVTSYNARARSSAICKKEIAVMHFSNSGEYSKGEEDSQYMERCSSDSIVSFLSRHDRQCVNTIHDENETHVPFSQKREVCDPFSKVLWATLLSGNPS